MEEKGRAAHEKGNRGGGFGAALCESLTGPTLPSGAESIGRNAFERGPNLTLTVPRDAYAARYAKENGIPYVYPDSHDWLND